MKTYMVLVVLKGRKCPSGNRKKKLNGVSNKGQSSKVLKAGTKPYGPFMMFF